MPKIIVFPDAAARTISYLVGHVDGATIAPEVPPKWAWDGLLITVADVGGSGVQDHVFDVVRITVELSHPDQAVAHDTAQKVYGLLREWPWQEPGVYFRGTIQRPTWWPDDETRTPLYKLTLLLAFRGEQVESAAYLGG